MAKVAKFAAGTTLSIRAFCEQARKDRETVANRVRAARIAPVDKRGGHDVYLLGDLLDAVFIRDDSGQIDPSRLPPFERKAHYQAEHEMLTLQTARAELVPLINYSARQTARGVTVSVKNGRKLIAHAFIATMGSGHQGVFIRVDNRHKRVIRNGKVYYSGLPIKELFGPSVPSAFANAAVQDALKTAIEERFPVVLKQELKFAGVLR